MTFESAYPELSIYVVRNVRRIRDFPERQTMDGQKGRAPAIFIGL